MSCFLSSFENFVSFLTFSPSGDHLGDLPLLGTPHKLLVQVGKDFQNCGSRGEVVTKYRCILYPNVLLVGFKPKICLNLKDGHSF